MWYTILIIFIHYPSLCSFAQKITEWFGAAWYGVVVFKIYIYNYYCTINFHSVIKCFPPSIIYICMLAHINVMFFVCLLLLFFCSYHRYCHLSLFGLSQLNII